ncbi:Ankyrin repeat family protein [Forsythia ovata]|uniref:Ankyrin repeat family protein n=1 Tax=Forsythia ovata TaxID=205694 RepID=A0ABD1W3V2_9LAMI
MDTSQDPDIITLYDSIYRNPDYLEGPYDKLCFETPLHRAASEGHTRLALEMLRLKPSLGKKLNLDGLSPLDMALRNERTATVKGLIRYDPNLIRVQGRGGITPLHYVVEMENIDLLIRFLLECPSSIKDLTVGQETALHIAVRKQNFTAFKVLIGWIKRTGNTKMLRWRDDEGNTVLHLAALSNQQQVMKLLINLVDVNAENSEGKTALDIVDQNPRSENARKILMSAGNILTRASAYRQYLKDPPCDKYLSSGTNHVFEMGMKFGAYLEFGLSGDMRNAFLVIIALFATATFEAALTHPPAFSNWHNTSVDSTNNIHNKTQISEFTIVNTICFGMAMGTSFVLTSHQLIAYLCGPLYLFLVAFAILTDGGVVKIGYIIISAMMAAFFVPILLVLPWLSILVYKESLTKRSDDYSLFEALYLIYSTNYARRSCINCSSKN